MRRPRGPGGRFLTADEIAVLEKTGQCKADCCEFFFARALSCGHSARVCNHAKDQAKGRQRKFGLVSSRVGRRFCSCCITRIATRGFPDGGNDLVSTIKFDQGSDRRPNRGNKRCCCCRRRRFLQSASLSHGIKQCISACLDGRPGLCATQIDLGQPRKDRILKTPIVCVQLVCSSSAHN